MLFLQSAQFTKAFLVLRIRTKKTFSRHLYSSLYRFCFPPKLSIFWELNKLCFLWPSPASLLLCSLHKEVVPCLPSAHRHLTNTLSASDSPEYTQQAMKQKHVGRGQLVREIYVPFTLVGLTQKKNSQ